LLFVEKLIGIV